ncbi:MAG: 6-carboxytetrahydropterin synthase [Gammaproteobacteria bacterium]|jgi:6-pyruvoyltetrahydropterin/6-carboxytetrahydropterin synthase|nr:6-carboxytetrahydropterin synthase [Gammaproteobacteria bacterium]NBT44408.1 6-carboxytetrahydropterin synthase [Gammaproteobacteria bacterium]NBY23211.1 6-carboxytetrahydropterin synthase [Gammaproteobacteria bacterium]NDE34299.1 6-carboxytetrahydropterin synthase [Gammaproteobacteria bacterium]NDE56253.1 6-carboxytetrahydropterin synthase [Gammaproteobacteria bacterium]
MYQLAIGRDFIARHFLVGGDWGAENVEHSHHYRIEVQLQGASLNQHGYLVDIVELEAALGEVIGLFRDNVLNSLPDFEGLNPSIEHFSRILYQRLSDRLALSGVTISVKLFENDLDWAGYTGPT